MFNSGLLVTHAHACRVEKEKKSCILAEEKEAVTLTLFVSFNPMTEFGQKCLNPAPFNDLSAYSLYGGCGVRMQDTDTSSLHI